MGPAHGIPAWEIASKLTRSECWNGEAYPKLAFLLFLGWKPLDVPYADAERCMMMLMSAVETGQLTAVETPQLPLPSSPPAEGSPALLGSALVIVALTIVVTAVPKILAEAKAKEEMANARDHQPVRRADGGGRALVPVRASLWPHPRHKSPMRAGSGGYRRLLAVGSLLHSALSRTSAVSASRTGRPRRTQNMTQRRTVSQEHARRDGSDASRSIR